MTDQEYSIILGAIVFEDINQKKNRGPIEVKHVPVFNCIFVATFCHFVYYLSLLFENSSFQKLVTNQLFGWEFSVVQPGKFYHH